MNLGLFLQKKKILITYFEYCFENLIEQTKMGHNHFLNAVRKHTQNPKVFGLTMLLCYSY